MLYYTTHDNTLNGRASFGFRNEQSAMTTADQQNARAEILGIKARYSVQHCENSEIPSKEHRD